MGKFKQLEEFEKRFASMDAAELSQWRAYWVTHAQNLAPRVRKEAMRRVHKIDKAIHDLESEQLDRS